MKNQFAIGKTASGEEIRFEMGNEFEILCQEKNLVSLDLSNCSELQELRFFRNHLTELNISNCPDLRILDCSENKISKLNLLNLNKLHVLKCSDNQLTEIDVSNFPVLRFFYCFNNQLTELDISKCPNLLYTDTSNNRFSPLLPAEKTIIINNARKFFLENPKGLCIALRDAVFEFIKSCRCIDYGGDAAILSIVFPKFTQENAVKYFGGNSSENYYWWEKNDVENRLKFLDFILE
jgi:hypothetical protein